MNSENFYHETIEFLSLHGKSPKDIKWMGFKFRYTFGWETFKRLANKEYNNGFGDYVYNDLLVIVGDGWWLSMENYDGLCNWRYNECPPEPDKKELPRTLR